MDLLITALTAWLACGAFVATIASFALIVLMPETCGEKVRQSAREVGIVNPNRPQLFLLLVLLIGLGWLDMSLKWPWILYEVLAD